jgi:type IV pilus biogenesis protein CpaD/CtpE
MSARSPRRPVAAIWLAAILSILVAACAGPAAAPSSGPATSGPTSDPGAAIDVDALLAAAAAKDGQVVRVTGNFLADEGSAQLCAVLMESYPPQCGGGVRLTGEVPGDTLAALDTTTEPDLKKMWWGYVTVTGTFRASGADGRPVIELGEISLVEG